VSRDRASTTPSPGQLVVGVLLGLSAFPTGVLLMKLQTPLDEWLLVIAVVATLCVVAGALIGKWWAPVIVVAQPWLYAYVITNPPDDPESLKGIFVAFTSIAFAVFVWIGVGARGRMRSKPNSSPP